MMMVFSFKRVLHFSAALGTFYRREFGLPTRYGAVIEFSKPI
jgi:hypothetical protein